MPLLQAEAIGVSFLGLKALQVVDLSAEAGTITGLIGPNGAGKTTMFNVICGIQPVDGGSVSFDGGSITTLSTHERARLGIARTFQRLEVFGSLTALENVMVAIEIRNRWAKEKVESKPAAIEILKTVGIAHVADNRADSMPTGLARLVELARALATRPRLILLDEPSSGLSDTESDFFAELLERLTGEGLAVLLVEHDVELVMRLCSRIHVLDFGKLIAVGSPKDIQGSKEVQAAYLGAAPDSGAA